MGLQVVDKNNPIPRHLQVKKFLEDRIRYGQYSVGSRIPTENELAEEFKVSHMTVNKAILSLVGEGYLHREQGRGTFVLNDPRPTGATAMNVGVVVNISAEQAGDDFYLGSLFRGMQRAVVNAPVKLAILEAGRSQHLEAEVDGFLMVDVLGRDAEAVQKMYEAGKRVVMLGAKLEQVHAPTIDSDNTYGTRSAIAHLAALGHQRIAGVFTLLRSSNTIDRIAAFHASLKEHGLPDQSGYIVSDDDLFPTSAMSGQLTSSAREQVLRLLRQTPRPTAIFCGGFYLSLGIMQAIRDLGMRIPEDISIVGFDDPRAASLLSPPLTTIRQPLDDMGYRAMSILMEWFQTRTEPVRREVLATSLIVRRSTAPPPPQ